MCKDRFIEFYSVEQEIRFAMRAIDVIGIAECEKQNGKECTIIVNSDGNEIIILGSFDTVLNLMNGEIKGGCKC